MFRCPINFEENSYHVTSVLKTFNSTSLSITFGKDFLTSYAELVSYDPKCISKIPFFPLKMLLHLEQAKAFFLHLKKSD